AVALYAFDYLGAELATSEAAVWNQQSLGVSRSLGYDSTESSGRPGAARRRRSKTSA
ncbi:hypothetical protein AHiyo6_20200, partial [Arthrobacter sp. Hiyo6]